ncbi:MAG TPA: hypothetical protein VIN59_01325 [Alphaproteobacteria bacterium]
MGLVEEFQEFVKRAEAEVQLPTKAVYARLNINLDALNNHKEILHIQGDAHLTISDGEKLTCSVVYQRSGKPYVSTVTAVRGRDRDFMRIEEVIMDNQHETSGSRDEIASVLSGIGRQVADVRNGKVPEIQRTQPVFSPFSRFMTRLAGLYESRTRYSLG